METLLAEVNGVRYENISKAFHEMTRDKKHYSQRAKLEKLRTLCVGTNMWATVGKIVDAIDDGDKETATRESHHFYHLLQAHATRLTREYSKSIDNAFWKHGIAKELGKRPRPLKAPDPPGPSYLPEPRPPDSASGYLVSGDRVYVANNNRTVQTVNPERGSLPGLVALAPLVDACAY